MSAPESDRPLSAYGEQVDCPPPFRLDRLDQLHHRNGEVTWRLSIGNQVIGYTTTDTLDTPLDVLLGKLFAERAMTAAAWESDPYVLVRSKRGSLRAMFAYADDAAEYVEKHGGTMHTLQGERVVGVNGHGHRILDTLRAKGQV